MENPIWNTEEDLQCLKVVILILDDVIGNAKEANTHNSHHFAKVVADLQNVAIKEHDRIMIEQGQGWLLDILREHRGPHSATDPAR